VPGSKLTSRLASSNAAAFTPRACQVSTQRIERSSGATSHTEPSFQPSVSPIEPSTRRVASATVVASISARATAL
jgi:hypothetical protein